MAEITLADLLAWEPRLSLTGGDGLERPGALRGRRRDAPESQAGSAGQSSWSGRSPGR